MKPLNQKSSVKSDRYFTFVLIIFLIFVAFILQIYAQKESVKESTLKPAQLNQEKCRRKLRAVLYPFIPAKTEFFNEVEQLFEAKHTDIDLQIVDLSDNYYDTSSPNNIVDADADIYEIDSVFLFDFVKSKKIKELPLELITDDLLINAKSGSQLNGKWYGSPHWVCGNFLFYKSGDNTFQSAKNLSDIEKIITNTPGARQGLFIDLKGKSTLGELYLDSAFDRYNDWYEVLPHLINFDSTIEQNIRRVMLLCNTGFCRNSRYHDTTGFYARQFARKQARALVSYSEGLFYALSETQQSCADNEGCLTDTNIEVSELPLDNKGSQPISWVDSLTIDSKCTGECQKDAIKLISFLTSEEIFLKAIMPKYMQPSRYLLPARASIYNNQDLIKNAPLYPKLKAIIEKAVTPTGEKLNDKLRTFGKEIDKRLNSPNP